MTAVLCPIARHWRLAALAFSAMLGILAALSGFARSPEHTLSAASAQLRRHPASGDLHIVEIDARSIAAIDRWPWPRRNYAAVVDQLRRAGAASIAFDVDFSSHSDPQDDAAFAAALARPGSSVILPTFGQKAGGGRGGWTDSLPIPALREHAALAAVSILPDADGAVRRAPIATMTDGLPRPSLSAMIAGISGGAADSNFPVDYAIDPTTIPRHSFIDIRDGRFDPAAIAGKRVLIGATAIEMGDRYAVPNYGVIPGVVIQAIAAETLRAGVPREGGWVLPLLFALLCGWGILHLRRSQALFAAVIIAPAALFGLSVIARAFLASRFPVVPGLIALTSLSAAAYAMRILVAARKRRFEDLATGLPNRHAMRGAVRANAGLGVVAARFAEYDKLASALGDRATMDLIHRVCERIAMVTGGETVFRVEHRVLAWQCDDAEQLEIALATLRALMLSPVEVAGRRVDVSLVYGFSPARAHEDADGTIARALLAADQALALGQNWQVHDAQDDETVDRELSLLGELDEAIANRELDVHYQPKLCLKTNLIASVEALVRWNHPTRGPLRPDLFVPLAERNGRIAGLTLHVLERTISDLHTWKVQGHAMTAAVNLSAKLLNSATFLAELRSLIETSGIAPHVLTFEVTESAAMTNAAEAAAALESFQAMGIAISIDDYGTGQSTLSYLKQLPLDELKIDRSFVQFAHQNRSDGVLVQSTINLAHELGLKVVAEGVEDPECMAFLRAAGCDMIQGYLISKAVPAKALSALLERPVSMAA
ncbi:EAL domain-containing protein [Novosphingobium sp. PS1R-30]|uniref:EAL domain-containing protein n=1 Tax=Novosphingobium anseongense TaxID=3133436 RepID=A0ABU8S2R6_9SPHN